VYHILVYFNVMPHFQSFCHFGTVELIKIILILFIFPVELRTASGHGLRLWGDNTHWTHQARYDPSGRAINPTQRIPLDSTQQVQEKNTHVPRRESNPQFQEANGCRRIPQAAPRPLTSALLLCIVFYKPHNSEFFQSFMPNGDQNVLRILLNM
jgi:hypothetical protein